MLLDENSGVDLKRLISDNKYFTQQVNDAYTLFKQKEQEMGQNWASDASEWAAKHMLYTAQFGGHPANLNLYDPNPELALRVEQAIIGKWLGRTHISKEIEIF